MSKITTPCVLLAGGRSVRMRKDKTQLNFNGSPLALYMYSKLNDTFQSVYIACKDKHNFTFDAHFIIESSPIFAPMSAMIAAFENLNTPEICFVSVDTPFIFQNSLRHIAKAQAQIALAKSPNKTHYLLSKWHIDTLPSLKAAFKAKDYALHKVATSFQCQLIDICEEEGFNINTPQDYKRALIMQNAINFLYNVEEMEDITI